MEEMDSVVITGRDDKCVGEWWDSYATLDSYALVLTGRGSTGVY